MKEPDDWREWPPAYLLQNRELWRAWTDIQSKGGGSAEGKGWKITSGSTPEGSVMTLEVFFV